MADEKAEYVVGLAPQMGLFGKRHAVREDARTSPHGPVYIRHEGYKALYKAVDGLVVYRAPNGSRYWEGVPFDPGDPRACKSCVRLVRRKQGGK